MKDCIDYKDYYFCGEATDLKKLNLPTSTHYSRHTMYINGNGCHIVIYFSELYLYEHNEIVNIPNAWHCEIINLLKENNLLVKI